MNTDTPETDALAKAACDDTGTLCRPEILWDAIERFERQRDELQQWKAEQLIVESQWDTQAIGKELNLPLGSSIHAGILPAVQQLKAALEREQMRLVACDVIAMCDTPESAAEARKMHQDYESAALDSVKRRVDECIALRQMVRELRDALENIVSVGCEFYDMDMGDNGADAVEQSNTAITKANQLLP